MEIKATSRGPAIGLILVVAAILGGALAFIFLPLMGYARAQHDDREFRIWLAEWVFFDVVLTAFLTRKEIAFLFRRPPPTPEQSKRDAAQA